MTMRTEPEKWVPEHAMLAFDPSKIPDLNAPDSVSKCAVRGIFQDPLARTLWMAFKWRHFANQYFNDDCVRIANSLRERPATNVEALSSLCYLLSPTNFRGAEQDFFEQLLPYVTGQKTLTYEVTQPEKGKTDGSA